MIFQPRNDPPLRKSVFLGVLVPKSDSRKYSIKGDLWVGMAFATIVMLGLLSCSAIAQPDRPMLREQLRDRVVLQHLRQLQLRDRVNTIMIAKLDEYLDLTMEQAEQFFPKFRHFNNQREELEQSRRDAMGDLITVEDSEPDNEKKIEDLIDRLESIDGNLINLNREFRKEIRSILTPRQRARFVIFSQRFPEQIRRIIEDVRRERAGRDEGPPPRHR